jgi:hypothetical protein
MMYLKYRVALFSLLTSTLFTFGYHHQAYGLILFDQKVDYQVGSIPSSVAPAGEYPYDLIASDLNGDARKPGGS